MRDDELSAPLLLVAALRTTAAPLKVDAEHAVCMMGRLGYDWS